MKPTTIHEFRRRYPIRPNDEAFILGSGSYGKVVKVEDQVETEWVAVKISEFKGDDSKSLRAEVELARKIPRHPNIARYDESYRFETDTNVCDFAIMRYYPDGNLAMLMRQNDLTLSQKDEIVRGVLLGLQHLHRQRIVHRDFKPANILISRDNQGRLVPKIADFGLSKLVHEDEIESSDFDLSDGRGTPSYKAPEQIVGGKVSFNLDLWAFGVILFELFTGEKPFAASQKSGSEHVLKREIEKKIVNVVIPESVRQIPEPYQALIRRCLVKDVRKRARKEDELLDLLDRIPTLLSEAQRLVEEGDFTEAIARYEAVLSRRENHPKAIEGLKAARELARNQEPVLLAVFTEADALFERQAYVAAREAYEAVLKSNPRNQHATQRVAACTAALHTQTVGALWQEAERLFATGAFQAAKARYANVLAMQPSHAQARTRLGDVEKAERQHQLDSWLAEAEEHLARKEYAQARRAYETVLTLDNQHAVARERLTHVDNRVRQQRIDDRMALAQKLFAEKQYAQAQSEFGKVLNEDEGNKTARQGVTDCAAALTPRPGPATRPTGVFKPSEPEESTDIFVPEKVLPAETKPKKRQPPAPAAIRQPPQPEVAEPVEARRAPARPGFAVRPLYGWVAGVVLAVSVGGYYWSSRPGAGNTPEPRPGTQSPGLNPEPKTPEVGSVAGHPGGESPTTPEADARQEQYKRSVQQAITALNAGDPAKAKEYIGHAYSFNPAGRELKKLRAGLRVLEEREVNQKVKQDETTRRQAAQTQYEALIARGVEVIESGNKKAEAIGYFQQAQQLAQANGLSTTKGAEQYANYVAKGDRIFQRDDPEGAKPWYLVAQALVNSDEIRRKIRECNN